MASSTDSIGCFANNATDADMVMEIMAGQDKKDMTTLEQGWLSGSTFEKKKAGVIRQFMAEGSDPSVRQAVADYVVKLESLGYQVDEVDLDMAKYSLAMYYIIMPAEVMSNLARYDGVHYGSRSTSAKTLADVYDMSRDEGFELENKRRIMMGSFVLSRGYFDAYYLKAQKARRLLINEFKQLFNQYDILLGPVSPTPAFKIGENSSEPMKMYLADVMTVPASVAGLPAISVPSTQTDDGLPVGVQLIGDHLSDHRLLMLAKSVEELN